MFLAQFWRSTVGKKIVMAVTGLIMIGFVIGHLAGNLLVFAGRGRINAYSAFLHSTGEVLWGVRLVLLVSVILHITAAVQLTAIDRAARPIGYAKHQYEAATWASRTIRWGGVLLLVFIVYHLLHMTVGTVHPSFTPGDVYHNLITGLSVWYVAAFYLIAMLALGLHLYHGTWSSIKTLGLEQDSRVPLRRRRMVWVFAVVMTLGFAVIPLAVVLGVIR
ncbi:MAG TPA: succinate dehydrogenase cytochrome b subunit [Gemmatimonadaceae bacterium]|nr:succinate dehydrogenase cytochrome b subunit [Gemmatimonadaceae bacterium]